MEDKRKIGRKTSACGEVLGFLTLVISGALFTINVFTLNNSRKAIQNDDFNPLLSKGTKDIERSFSSAHCHVTDSMLQVSCIFYFIGLIAGTALLLGIKLNNKKLIACWMAYSVLSCLWSLASLTILYERVPTTVQLAGALGNVFLFLLGNWMVCISVEEEHSSTSTRLVYLQFLHEECDKISNKDPFKLQHI